MRSGYRKIKAYYRRNKRKTRAGIEAAIGAGAAMGASRTYTKTKTKRKKKINSVRRVMDIGFTAHSKYLKGSEKTIKRWMKDGIHVRHKYSAGQSFTSTNGVQAANNLPVTICTRGDIDTVNQKVIDAVVTGSTAIQGSSAIRKVKMEIQMKNQTNDEIEVWLYYIACKKDIPSGANLPITAWDLGVDDQLNASGTPFDYPYSDPRESQLFNQTYRVLKKTLYRMKSGAMVNDTFKYYPNKVMNEDYLQRYSGLAGYANLTIYPILVQLGPIGHRLGFAPTYGPSKVDVIQHIDYDIYGHADRRNLQTNVSALDVVAGNVTAMTDADETTNNIVVVP